jgi:hypothetical protein
VLPFINRTCSWFIVGHFPFVVSKVQRLLLDSYKCLYVCPAFEHGNKYNRSFLTDLVEKYYEHNAKGDIRVSANVNHVLPKEYIYRSGNVMCLL